MSNDTPGDAVRTQRHKLCRTCKLRLPVEAFGAGSGSLGLRGSCRECYLQNVAIRLLSREPEEISAEKTKPCSVCVTEKPLTEFYVSYGRTIAACKSCTISRVRARDAANKNKVRRQRQEAYRARGDYQRLRDRIYRYGLSAEDYEHLWRSQDGCCGSCREALMPGIHGEHIDHDHATGRVRGILCGSCNLMIGHAKEDPARLLMAVDYLKKVRTEGLTE